jgi:ubiquitin-protein ligase
MADCDYGVSPVQYNGKERKKKLIIFLLSLQSDHATWTLFLDSNTCLQYNRPADTLYEGAILRARLIFPEVSLPPPPRGLADVQEYPLQPPKMIFDSEMWHPNVYSTSDKKGEVCISILVSFPTPGWSDYELTSSTHQGMMNGDMKMQERGGYPSIPSRLS